MFSLRFEIVLGLHVRLPQTFLDIGATRVRSYEDSRARKTVKAPAAHGIPKTSEPNCFFRITENLSDVMTPENEQKRPRGCLKRGVSTVLRPRRDQEIESDQAFETSSRAPEENVRPPLSRHATIFTRPGCRADASGVQLIFEPSNPVNHAV